eukprot:4746731-Prymnesium_polylepis.1
MRLACPCVSPTDRTRGNVPVCPDGAPCLPACPVVSPASIVAACHGLQARSAKLAPYLRAGPDSGWAAVAQRLSLPSSGWARSAKLRPLETRPHTRN